MEEFKNMASASGGRVHGQAPYQALFEAARDGILVLDGERFIDCNPRVLEMLRCDSPQILGRTPFELSPVVQPDGQDSAQKGRQVIAKALDGQPQLFEWRLRRDDGAEFDAEVSLTRMDIDDRPLLLAVVRDITERKRTEQVLRATQERFDQIAAQSSMIWEVDAKGLYLYVSPACEELLGYRPDEMIGKMHFYDLCPPEDRKSLMRDAFRIMASKKVFTDYANKALTKDGRVIWLTTSGAPFLDERGRLLGYRGLDHDMSDRKAAEEAIQRAKDELETKVAERTLELRQTIDMLHQEIDMRMASEQSLRERSAQLQMLASELTLVEHRERQRLAQVLHDGLQQLLVSAKLRLASLDRIEHPNVRQFAAELLGLMDNAISMSRSLTAQLSPPVLREGGLVQALQWLARWMQKEYGLSVQLSAPGEHIDMPENLALLLFQATRELLLNIVKHAGVSEARVQVARDDQWIRIAVVDQGAGFDPTHLPSAGGHAEGLGLFSIKERLDLQAGRLTIESAPGQGTRATLVAPVSPAVETAPQAEYAPLRQAALPVLAPAVSDRDKIRVVLADDHAVMRQAVAALLREQSDIMIAGDASDGELAVEMVRQVRPDVVLMDVSMPHTNGIEATRIIRHEFPSVSVIGLSMYEEADRANEMLQAGAVSYISKSAPANDVIAAIRACAANRH